jgi:UMF1 family MFS transporter
VTSTYKKSIFSWLLYDWANSAFATTIMAAVLPIYYSKVAASTLAPHLATSYWGYTNTVSMLIVSLSAPVLGALADYRRAKLKFLGAFALLGILFSGLLFLVQTGDWLMASCFYILGYIGFSSANIFYDSLLPSLTGYDSVDRISALGYATGYLGGGILLAVNIAMILSPEWFHISSSEMGSRISFLSVAGWWLLFMIPLFIYIREPVAANEKKTLGNPFKDVLKTVKELRKYRDAFLFLIAFWLYNDGIGTIIKMAVIFGSEIGIGVNHLIGAILAVQFIGVPFTILFGKVAKKITAKRAIYLGLIIYTCIAIGGYFMRSAVHFWILAIAVSMVQGGTQALSRSLFAVMVPRAKSAEFFGFFDVSQKFSGIVGPALFGFVGYLTGSSRLGIVALIVFFIGGMYLLEKVRLREGMHAAKIY